MAAPAKEIRLSLTSREAAGLAAGAAVVAILLFLAGVGMGASGGCAPSGPQALAETAR